MRSAICDSCWYSRRQAHRRGWMIHPRDVAVREIQGLLSPFFISSTPNDAMTSGRESGASDDGNDRRGNGDRGAGRSGRRAPFRLSRRRGAADLRRPVSAGQGEPHPGAARAGRRARGRRLCALDRQGRHRAGHLRPRRHQRGHRPDRRAVRFDSAGRHHRPGADPSHRQRRVPGMRHRRHHPAVHQIQLSGEDHRRSAAGAARGVPYRGQRPAGSGRGRYPEGHPVRQGHLLQAEGIPAPRLPAQGQGRPRQDQASGRHDGGRQAAAVLHRRRRDQFRPRRDAICCANWSSSPAFRSPRR